MDIKFANMETNLNIVLVSPEIPHNTGAVGRLAVGLGCRLHLIRPLGFHLDDRSVLRAGLDYWEHLDILVHSSWEDFLQREKCPTHKMAFLSTHGHNSLYQCNFAPGDYLVFGSESSGLPKPFHEQYGSRMFRIPMPGPHARSINLANAVSIAVYEAYRQAYCTAS